MEEVTRPFRVCVTGAESTGKSALARALAAHFSVPQVPEYSRQYAEPLARELEFLDVVLIARGQIALEDLALSAPSGLIILDTDLLSTVVYSRHHFGACPAWVETEARARRAELYLLLDVDVPWVADPVRDSGDRRVALHEAFRRTLEDFEAQYELVRGSWDERFRRAAAAISGHVGPALSRPNDL